jgi:hypothetical protein
MMKGMLSIILRHIGIFSLRSTQSFNPNFDRLFGLVDLLLWWGALFKRVD